MYQERTMEEILREIREICANEDRPINREPESHRPCSGFRRA